MAIVRDRVTLRYPLHSPTLLPRPHLNPLILLDALLSATPTCIRHLDRPPKPLILRTRSVVDIVVDTATVVDDASGGVFVVAVAELGPALETHSRLGRSVESPSTERSVVFSGLLMVELMLRYLVIGFVLLYW